LTRRRSVRRLREHQRQDPVYRSLCGSPARCVHDGPGRRAEVWGALMNAALQRTIERHRKFITLELRKQRYWFFVFDLGLTREQRIQMCGDHLRCTCGYLVDEFCTDAEFEELLQDVLDEPVPAGAQS